MATHFAFFSFSLLFMFLYTPSRIYRNEAEGMDAGSRLLIPPTYRGGGALRCIEFVIPKNTLTTGEEETSLQFPVLVHINNLLYVLQHFDIAIKRSFSPLFLKHKKK